MQMLSRQMLDVLPNMLLLRQNEGSRSQGKWYQWVLTPPRCVFVSHRQYSGLWVRGVGSQIKNASLKGNTSGPSGPEAEAATYFEVPTPLRPTDIVGVGWANDPDHPGEKVLQLHEVGEGSARSEIE